MAIQRTTPSTIGLGTALNSLASSATAGAQSDEVVSGTTNNVVDIVAIWSFTIGTITPSTATRLDVYVWGTNDDSGYPGAGSVTEVITGSSGTITISSSANASIKFLKSTTTHTSATTYKNEASIVNALGFVPRKWGLIFINQTGSALSSSGHSAEYVETYYT